MDREILQERIRETLGTSPHPLSARELGRRLDADPYELRSALTHLRRLGDLAAAMGGDSKDTLVYRLRAEEEPPQPMVGLTTRSKNGNGANGHKANGKSAVDIKGELLSVIDGLCEGNATLLALVRLYGHV